MKKKTITLQCEKCGKDFDYLYIGKGPMARYCEDCKKQPKRDVTESLLYLRKKMISEIKVLFDEIIGFQLIWLEEPHNHARGEEQEIVDKDFERLERLLDIVEEINEHLEERGEQNGN